MISRIALKVWYICLNSEGLVFYTNEDWYMKKLGQIQHTLILIFYNLVNIFFICRNTSKFDSRQKRTWQI